MSDEPLPYPACTSWYAVLCKPRKEIVAEENLERQGFRIYLPRIQVPKRRRGQWQDVVEPLFPRYLFVNVDADQISVAPIRSTLGVTGLVRFADRPARVPCEVIQALMNAADLDTGLHKFGRPLFQPGDRVRFMEGPFAGLEGIFSLEKGEERAIVLLELLGNQNRVPVPRSWLEPV